MRTWMAIAVMMFAAVGHAGKAEAYFYSASEVLGWCESDAKATRILYTNLYTNEHKIGL